MKKRVAAGRFVAIVLTGILAWACGAPAPSREAMIEDVLQNREDVVIVVTDSGLGGLSVAAELAARLPKSGIFRRARIVYYNALFHDIGYNGLESEAEKARIFDAVLKAMDKRYRPDLLLIACNTLSVVYENTKFSRRAPFPVVGILETGVDLIAQQFEKTPEATAILFATRTTIASETHKNRLVALGIPPGRIVGQACHLLAGAIERGPESEETSALIRQFVGEALEKVGDSSRPIFGSFNCTHYGYARETFAAAFAEAGHPDIALVDPNPRMIDFMFRLPYLHRFLKTDVEVKVVSKLKITEDERAAIGPLIAAVSPAAAEALDEYRLDPELFKVRFKPPVSK
jgi:glutamate racemase